MWAGFDPRAEPLDVDVLKQWEEDVVALKVLRYRIGVFKGQKAMIDLVAAVGILQFWLDQRRATLAEQDGASRA